MDDSKMMANGQRQMDPRRLMRRGSKYNPATFNSQLIIHIDPDFTKSNLVNYFKQILSFKTWNALSLVILSSQIYLLGQNIDQCKLNLLGIKETHLPGSSLLDNGSLLIHSSRTDGIKRQGLGLGHWLQSF